MRTALKRLSSAQRSMAMRAPTVPDETRARMMLDARYGERLGQKGIRGFDLVRALCLARWGHTAGFINEEETWNVMMPLAQQARKTFASWEEYGTSYLVGRRFWSPEDDEHEDAEKMYKELLAPGGSWSQSKWETDLTPKP